MAPKIVRLRHAAAVHPYRRPASAADGGRRIADRPDGGGGGNHSQCSNVVGYMLNFDDLFRDGVFRMQCFRCPMDPWTTARLRSSSPTGGTCRVARI